ncbi:MAG: ornithine cyclodeaminase family protein, partial [Alphaproteobacteria bacterium]|nr:ornithine cyclodeaminase family protein [Alphaproteobacteria bacterium]
MSPIITILTEPEIRTCVQMDAAALEVVAAGFAAIARDQVTIPPILRIDVAENHGEVDVKTAYIHGYDSFAIKIAAGFLENFKLGLPTGSGMMVIINAQTGQPQAVLLDNGYLTDIRTGIAGGLAAQYCAPPQVDVAGVIGSGAQARFQMRGLKLVRDFSRLYVYGVVPDEVAAYAQEMTAELNVEVIMAPDAETVVRNSQVVVTTTPAHEPYLRADWLHPGLHITSMGSDAEHKQELHADVFAHADRIFCDKRSQVFRLGELHHAFDA